VIPSAMLTNLLNKFERIASLGTSGPWWWRLVGGAISLVVLVTIVLVLGHAR
jgi:hypothetical protein